MSEAGVTEVPWPARAMVTEVMAQPALQMVLVLVPRRSEPQLERITKNKEQMKSKEARVGEKSSERNGGKKC